MRQTARSRRPNSRTLGRGANPQPDRLCTCVSINRTTGQASAEYVATLLVVAAVLAGAGTAVAVPGVAERVVTTVRTGICIVGGDVCRGGDAEAAGLPPCLTRERARGEGTTLD